MSDGLTDALRRSQVCSCISDPDSEENSFVCQLCLDSIPKTRTELKEGVRVVSKDEALKQGAKFDNGKPMMDLLSSAAMTEVAKVLTFGAKKYAAHNWRKGIAYSRVYAALQRHLTAWNEGQEIDPESGLPHLAHAGCCIMFLLEYTSKAEKYEKFDDRYKGEDDGI